MSVSYSAPRMNEEAARRELESMSEQDRMQAYRDLYGKQPQFIEDDLVIKRKLQELDQALTKVGNDMIGESFRKAQNQCPEIANATGFRRRFLRAKDYDVQVRTTRRGLTRIRSSDDLIFRMPQLSQ